MGWGGGKKFWTLIPAKLKIWEHISAYREPHRLPRITKEDLNQIKKN